MDSNKKIFDINSLFYKERIIWSVCLCFFIMLGVFLFCLVSCINSGRSFTGKNIAQSVEYRQMYIIHDDTHNSGFEQFTNDARFEGGVFYSTVAGKEQGVVLEDSISAIIKYDDAVMHYFGNLSGGLDNFLGTTPNDYIGLSLFESCKQPLEKYMDDLRDSSIGKYGILLRTISGNEIALCAVDSSEPEILGDLHYIFSSNGQIIETVNLEFVDLGGIK